MKEIRRAPRRQFSAEEKIRIVLEGVPRDAAVILTSATSKPWKKRYFSDRWKEASDAASLVDFHFHDLRGAVVTMLTEAGCTIPGIAAITGRSLRIAKIYRRQAERRASPTTVRRG